MNFQLYLKMKRGNILISDVIFVILTLVFVTLLFLFVSRQTSNVALLEEKVAKELALVIDASEPGNIITLNLKDFLKGKEFDENSIVIDNTNRVVKVKLGEYGKSYSYFSKNGVDRRINGDYLILEIT